jgi:hypothetical protein
MLSDDPIIAIHRGRKVAVAEDGSECPFTDMLDCLGEETDDAAEAVAAIVLLPDGRWAAIDLRAFGGEALN